MKSYTNKQTLLISLSICLVLTALMFCSIFMLESENVYADYEDILNDEDAIVNFNQLINNGSSFSNSTTDTRTFFTPQLRFNNVMLYQNGIDLNGTYYGYFTSTVGGTAMFRFYHSGSSTDITVYQNNSFTMVEGHIYYLRYYVAGSNPSVVGGLKINNLIFIDLSLMFGVGNEPTLQQCKDLFVADYYSYTSGQPVSLNGLNSYVQGVNDTLSSMDVTLNQYLVGSSAFAYNNASIFNSSIQYDSGYNAYVTRGVIGIPLLETVSSGTNLSIDFCVWDNTSGENQSYFMGNAIYFGYVDSNNSFVQISSMLPYRYENYGKIYYNGAFVLPITTDTIYFYYLNYGVNSSDSGYPAIIVDSNITFRSFNASSLITTAYSKGYSEALEQYAPGGYKYEEIYQAGKIAGINQENPYTFGYLMSSVIEAPLGAVLSIFNFDFMGYNFKNVITLVLTVCLILAVIRLFVGGN